MGPLCQTAYPTKIARVTSCPQLQVHIWTCEDPGGDWSQSLLCPKCGAPQVRQGDLWVRRALWVKCALSVSMGSQGGAGGDLGVSWGTLQMSWGGAW